MNQNVLPLSNNSVINTTNCCLIYPYCNCSSKWNYIWPTVQMTPAFPIQIKKTENGFLVLFHSKEYVFENAESLVKFIKEKAKEL